MSVWSRYQPTKDAPWNIRRVVHLHRRAGFAATWGEISRDLKDGVDAAVGRVLGGQARSDGVPGAFHQTADLIGGAAVAAGSSERLKAWWVYRMLFSPDPLGERLTLMWHNHFATSNLKVNDVRLMHEQNEIFRRFARAPLRELLCRAVKHPAMLIWLDAQANRKEHPNENLARELMELFTLGEGNYTESDVKQAARALTGWTVVRGEFREVSNLHDDGEKRLLGKNGRVDGDELLACLLAQPATARRLAWRLCDTFLGENVASETDIDAFGRELLAHDLDVGWAVETILRSRSFFSRRNLSARVAGPAQFAIGAVRALELFDPPPSTLLLAEQMTRIGQDLFYPPNVFGWAGGRSWINTRSLIGRGNFADALVSGKLYSPVRPADVQRLLSRHAVASGNEDVVDFFAQLILGSKADDSLTNVQREACRGVEGDQAARRIVATLLASPRAQLG